MGFNANASRRRTQEDMFQTENQTQHQTGSQNTTTNNQFGQQQSGTRSAVFDSPIAQQLLGALSGQASNQSGIGAYGTEAGNAYRSLAGDQGTVNPEVENIISAGNKEGDSVLANNLSKTRAAGYRGGTGANLYNQDKTIATAANERALGNSNLRYGAFNDAAGRGLTSRIAGASGLSGTEQQNQNAIQSNQGLGSQILALLRGENTTGQTSGTESGNSSTQTIADMILNAIRQGQNSGTTSNVGAGFSWGS